MLREVWSKIENILDRIFYSMGDSSVRIPILLKLSHVTGVIELK